jgi:hypothetical protein
MFAGEFGKLAAVAAAILLLLLPRSNGFVAERSLAAAVLSLLLVEAFVVLRGTFGGFLPVGVSLSDRSRVVWGLG